MINGNFKSQPGFIHPQTLDGVYFAPTIFKSAHIEGRGRYLDPVSGILVLLFSFCFESASFVNTAI